MSENESREPVPGIDPKLRSDRESDALNAAASAAEDELDAESTPEPWTPERVSEWNGYYDKYVMLGALLLAFVVSANRMTNSSLWTHLKTGEVILEQKAPVTTNIFSYTEPDRPWVNIPWLFQALHAGVYQLAHDFVPVNEADRVASNEKADQIAIGVLIGLNALVRVLTAFLLFQIRRPGPGLWWSAICAALALGAIWGPSGVMLGGIAHPGSVTPATWGLLLLALEVYLLHRAFNLGQRGAFYLLVPLFVLWVNSDESFLFGLAILAATAVGHLLDARSAKDATKQILNRAAQKPAIVSEETTPEPITPGFGLIMLAVCAVACLANPSIHRVYGAALGPIFRVFTATGDIHTPDQISFLNSTLRERLGTDWHLLAGFYGALLAIGFVSFAINRDRLSWSRLFQYVAAATFAVLLLRYVPEFAIVFAAILSLNGQEWYQARFGREGKLGASWTAWSTGGRLVTLTFIFLMVGKAITGYGNSEIDPVFGFGYRVDDFAFDSAEALKRADLKGNVFNTTLGQGDAIIWKSSPRKTFIDGRHNFFDQELLNRFQKIRRALMEDKVDVWKPEFDKDNISAILIEYPSSTNTYQRLITSPNWIPFYDDGRVVMFGRADASAEDVAYFKANRLDAQQLAYHVKRPFVGFQRTPTATTWLDQIFQNRLFAKSQWRTEAARRWLFGGMQSAAAQDSQYPDLARCFLAIQEARGALSRDPDDWNAYRVLATAYQYVLIQESALLAGIPLKPENAQRILGTPPNTRALVNRFRQRVTALNFAIQTTPPPQTTTARMELIGLNSDLYQMYLVSNFFDLARDRLQVILDLFAADESIPQERRLFYSQQFEQLDEQVKRIEDDVKNLQIEQQANQVQQASFALSKGAPGIAIFQLEEAERTSISPAVVKPQLIDLYCSTGQPDKAFELIGGSPLNDPNLGSDPASAAMRQGVVHLLMGNYLSAITLLQERAIPSLRQERSVRVMSAAQAMIRGEAIAVTDADLAIPGSINQQSNWEFELGIAKLEGGNPEEAAANFTTALTLAPDMALRPIAAYYLEQLGKPVPPLNESASKETAPASPSHAPADAKPASAEPKKEEKAAAEPAKPASPDAKKDEKVEPKKP